MHNAPSVSYPVARPRLPGVLAGALGVAGAGATLLWATQAGTAGWRQALAALCLAGSGGWAVVSWRRSPDGEVVWDGTGWTVPDRIGAGSLEVTLDLQRQLLVHWRGPGASRWLWLERHRCPQRWMDLRRAVYSRARPQALPPRGPPAATP